MKTNEQKTNKKPRIAKNDCCYNKHSGKNNLRDEKVCVAHTFIPIIVRMSRWQGLEASLSKESV